MQTAEHYQAAARTCGLAALPPTFDGLPTCVQELESAAKQAKQAMKDILKAQTAYDQRRQRQKVQPVYSRARSHPGQQKQQISSNISPQSSTELDEFRPGRGADTPLQFLVMCLEDAWKMQEPTT